MMNTWIRRCSTILLFVLAAGLGGCNRLQSEFTWTRSTPAIGRFYPTKFTVRVKVDSERRVVTWLENAGDAHGHISAYVKSYENCEMFDKENWTCRLDLDDRIAMSKGKLTQHYWGEDRVFEPYRVWR